MSATAFHGRSDTPKPVASPKGRPPKAYKGLAMEGFIARWYDRTRGTPSQREGWKRQAGALVQDLPSQAEVLEVAAGPGYFAIEIARTGRVRVTTLDISRTFVQIAGENVRAAGVTVTVLHGDATHMPFADSSFDLLVCQAAFKNFQQPQDVVNEFYRVLRVGGVARIQDMSHDVSNEAIQEEVARMQLSGFRAYMTRQALYGLRRRAYTREQFEQFARASPFRGCEIEIGDLGFEVRLKRIQTSSSQGE